MDRIILVCVCVFFVPFFVFCVLKTMVLTYVGVLVFSIGTECKIKNGDKKAKIAHIIHILLHPTHTSKPLYSVETNTANSDSLSYLKKCGLKTLLSLEGY
jgi:hypothetical protein